jgi:magnesium transporter
MARTPLNRTPLTRTPLARSLPLRAVVPGRRAASPSAAGGDVIAACTFLDAVVDWARYEAGVRQGQQDFEQACAAARETDGFLWIGLHEPTADQLEQLGTVFDLHPLALEDAANTRQRPKIERYDDMLFLAMRTLAYVESDERAEGGDVVETGSVMVFVAEHAVITVRHGRHASMSGLRRRLEASPDLLRLGPSSVLHAVTDKVVDDYLAVVDAVNEDIEEIETNVFSPRETTDIERIYQLKRDLIEMKRTVGPLAGPLRELSERPRRLVHPEIREYFRDVEDHLARVREQVQSFDELLGSILQAGLARITVAENEDMRKISAWVAIAAVPTMIAGIYGMNFTHMPELSTTWGYPTVLGFMGAVCATLYRGFKRNGWL